MARRRADEEPGLMDRVRWRNVGRLGLLVAVLVLALLPRGCGRREPLLPPEVRVAPPPAPRPAPVVRPGKAEGRKQKAGRVKPRHRRRHRRRRPRHAPRVLRPALPRPAPPAPPPPPPHYGAPPPAPEFF